VDKKLFVWGPVFDDVNIKIPTELNTSSNVNSMSVGERTSCYVDDMGKMFSWGTHNDFG
jgi:hypothetical protein